MSEPQPRSASPNDAPSPGAAAEDVKMEDAPEDTAARQIKLEEDLFATDSEDDFPGPKGPDTPNSSNGDSKSQPTS